MSRRHSATVPSRIAGVPAPSASAAASVERPIRVLHVLKHMTGGGVESWLLQVMRHLDRRRFQMDIMVRDASPSRFDDAFRALGVNVMTCVRPAGKWTFASAFGDILQTHGPYDVVHCHTLFNRGYVLRLARLAGVPVRVAHSHNAPAESAGWVRRFRLGFRYAWMSPWWTQGLACSQPAAAELFGARWSRHPRFRLLYCGVDLDRFHLDEPPAAVRAELGIPEDAFVVGHVGRFEDQKNHPFMVEIAAEVVKREPRAHFLLVGEGGLKEGIVALVEQRGLSPHFIFAGSRRDVPRLMLGAMDAFLLPSFHEGLPLVGMEAQAAGLPMFVSDAITLEMDAVPGLVNRLSLAQSAEEWAAALLSVHNVPSTASRADALDIMRCSPFNVENSVRELQSFYEEALAAAHHSNRR